MKSSLSYIAKNILFGLFVLVLVNCSNSFKSQTATTGNSSNGTNPPPPAPTVSLNASPSSITVGGTSLLTWSSMNATSCMASGAWSGAMAASGTMTVNPTSTSTYTLSCTGAGGTATQSTIVNVTMAAAAPTVTLTASASSIVTGGSSTLTWSSTNAVSCTASGAWSGNETLSGTLVVSPTASATYNLSCMNSAGVSAQATTTITVTAAPATVTLTASAATIAAGASSTLTWSSTNAVSCTASGAWSGSQTLTGTLAVKPTATSTYTLTCVNSANVSASASTTITVTPVVNPSPSPSPSASPSPTPTPSPSTTPIAGSGPYKGLHVVKGTGGALGHIVDSSGQIVRMHGANHAATEYSCYYSGGTFSDGHLTQADLTEMKKWYINSVRVPLNEDCWLGINGAGFGGAAYQSALLAYVQLFTSNGMIVILDLHWAAPGTTLSSSQRSFVDADHSVTFWSQVAAAYASTGANDTSFKSMVMFDLFNEPFGFSDWNCWLKGGCTLDGGTATGMGVLLQAVRATGAQNIVMMGGLQYCQQFSGWLAQVNSIPTLYPGVTTDNIVASAHFYDFNFSGNPTPVTIGSSSLSDLDAVTAAGFPFVMGETGYTGGSSSAWFLSLLAWVDSQQQGYLEWAWNYNLGGANMLKSFTYTGGPTSYATPGMGLDYYNYVTTHFTGP